VRGDLKRWKGLKDLVQEAVDRGTAAVEVVHREAIRTPLGLLERVPSLAGTARAAAAVVDAALAVSYGTVRVVNRAAGELLSVGIAVAEEVRAARAAASRDAPPAPGAATPGDATPGDATPGDATLGDATLGDATPGDAGK
jgi:hypothetical protein